MRTGGTCILPQYGTRFHTEASELNPVVVCFRSSECMTTYSRDVGASVVTTSDGLPGSVGGKNRVSTVDVGVFSHVVGERSHIDFDIAFANVLSITTWQPCSHSGIVSSGNSCCSSFTERWEIVVRRTQPSAKGPNRLQT